MLQNYTRLRAALLLGSSAALLGWLSRPGGQAAILASQWPPHPSEIRQWPKGSIDTTLSPGDELTFFTVPPNRWLIITSCGYDTQIPPPGETVWTYIRGVDPVSGQEADRFPIYARFESNTSMGFVFPPASNVKVASSSSSQSPATTSTLELTGYLAKFEPQLSLWSTSNAKIDGLGVPLGGELELETTPSDKWLMVAWTSHGTGLDIIWRRGPVEGVIPPNRIPLNWDSNGTPVPPGSTLLVRSTNGGHGAENNLLLLARSAPAQP